MSFVASAKKEGRQEGGKAEAMKREENLIRYDCDSRCVFHSKTPATPAPLPDAL